MKKAQKSGTGLLDEVFLIKTKRRSNKMSLSPSNTAGNLAKVKFD